MTRDEILEALEDEGWHRLWPVDAILDALDALNQGPKRVAELEKVARPLAAIADAFEADALDEARPSWGDKPDGVEIYSGRGGKRLLTLDDAFAARAALKGQDNG
jgi:hypothetical protein